MRRHAGSVVEFNGDGMMAVFGAPQELRDKFIAQGQVIAELKGPQNEVEQGVRSLAGVQQLQASYERGGSEVIG